MVHGESRNYVSALVALDPEALAQWAAHEQIVPAGTGPEAYASIVANPATVAMVQGYIDELNEHLSRWETIKKFTLLSADLTVEAGELTPSMKLKRKYVEQKYMDQLDSMYSA